MSKEDRRQYIFAQLGSLPNAMQYVEVTKYIEDLEQQVKKQKEVIDKAIHLRDDFAKDNLTLIFENNELISFINNLLEILEDKEV